MPHFFAQTLQNFSLPLHKREFEFVGEFCHCVYPHRRVMLVCHRESTRFKEFLLSINAGQKVLYKCLKSTKPSPIGIVKDALSILMEHSNQVLSHNLSPNSHRQKVSSPFLLLKDEIPTFITQKLHNTKPLQIEIGFGSGRHLLHLAKSNPDVLFLGVEIHTPSLQQVLRHIELLELENLYVTNLDARLLIELLPHKCVSVLYIHFPVPWLKKPHRRVISKEFLGQIACVLKPTQFPQDLDTKSTNSGGFLHLRTDEEQYANFTYDIAQSLGFISRFSVDKNALVVSKYEARWRAKQKRIYDLFLTIDKNRQNLCCKNKNLWQNTTFIFPKMNETIRRNVEDLIAFFASPASIGANIEQGGLQGAIQKEDYFLHISAVYRGVDCVKGSFLLEVSLGDFGRVQNAFVLLDTQNAKVRYVNPPLPTIATLKAHDLLVSILESKPI